MSAVLPSCSKSFVMGISHLRFNSHCLGRVYLHRVPLGISLYLYDPMQQRRSLQSSHPVFIVVNNFMSNARVSTF